MDTWPNGDKFAASHGFTPPVTLLVCTWSQRVQANGKIAGFCALIILCLRIGASYFLSILNPMSKYFSFVICLFSCLFLWLIVIQPTAYAHPADEMCAGNTGLDPALCRALAALDTEADTEMDLGRSNMDTALLYIKLGITHILPKGLDHILFVLALFLASVHWRPLLLQISVFTLAHTCTLAMASMGWISLPAGLIEPLIAISIAFVALENLYFKDMTKWRPLVVFGFGLFHGLGFASVLGDLGLPPDQFLTSLISFNVGVELGQLLVILGAWTLLHRLYRRTWYRGRIAMPLSFIIAATGLYWAIERIWF